MVGIRDTLQGVVRHGRIMIRPTPTTGLLGAHAAPKRLITPNVSLVWPLYYNQDINMSQRGHNLKVKYTYLLAVPILLVDSAVVL